MNPRLRWFQHGANLAVAGTGVVYLVMKFALDPVDEWAVVNHPWQPHLQHLHILSAPLLTGILGWLVIQHGWFSWKGGVREGRRSGMLLLLLALPMIFSGYALQVSTQLAMRLAWVWVHSVSSVFWIGLAAVHVLSSWLRTRAALRGS